MKKPNHTSTCVSDYTSNPTCVSDDICNPAHVSDDISGLIKLWHVSPIRLCHMSLTNPQTPINRSLPKAFKQTPRTSTPKSKNIRSRIIQTICLDPKVCGNQAQKLPETSTNHKSTKLYEFKPLNHRRTSTTNLQRWRTHKAHERREEQRISNKLIVRDSL